MNRKALGFDDSESEEELETSKPVKRPNHRANNKDIIAQSLRNQAKAKQYEEENPEIYQYDEVYDDIEAQRELKKPKGQDDGGSKYIERLLEAKKQRQMDKLYLQDLKVQKERELEGDEFKDKETFVTTGYKEFREERARDRDEVISGQLNTEALRASITNTNNQHEELHRSDDQAKESRGGLFATSNRLDTEREVKEPIATLPESLKTIVDKTPKSRILPKLTDEEIQQYRERYLSRKAGRV